MQLLKKMSIVNTITNISYQLSHVKTYLEYFTDWKLYKVINMLKILYNLYIIKRERLVMLKLILKLARLFHLISTPLPYISSKP